MSLPEPPHADAAEKSRLAAIRAELDGLAATLRLAQTLVVSGERIDLTGLDDQIGQLCAGALDLSPATGRTLRADIVLLGLQISELSVALRARSPG